MADYEGHEWRELTAKPKSVVATERILQIALELEDLPDEPGKSVHALFARLYYLDKSLWLTRLERDDPDGFFDEFTRHFFEAYERPLRQCLSNDDLPSGSPWAAYQRLTRRTCMRDGVIRHLVILAAGARAHICGDIGPSLVAAADEFRARGKRIPDNARLREFYFSDANRVVLLRAGLRLIDHYRAENSGYRKVVLGVFRFLFPRMSWVWWPVMRSWRQQSWDYAAARISKISTSVERETDCLLASGARCS
ncbi:MAG: hypothetical protein AAF687_04655 [Pseudomonadota bacterium]